MMLFRMIPMRVASRLFSSSSEPSQFAAGCECCLQRLRDQTNTLMSGNRSDESVQSIHGARRESTGVPASSRNHRLRSGIPDSTACRLQRTTPRICHLRHRSPSRCMDTLFVNLSRLTIRGVPSVIYASLGVQYARDDVAEPHCIA